MSNQKIEGTPRSENFYRAAVYRSLHPMPGIFHPLVDIGSLKLARLFAKEEKLAEEIADDERTIDKNTVYRVVEMARYMAGEGYPTILVSAGEMLDIAQIFCLRNPDIARIAQELVLEDPQGEAIKRMRQAHGSSYPEYMTTLPTNPDPETASDILIKLLASLKESGNSVWTARVAAALAYFSELKVPLD